ncbi:MAG TPA: M1 family aminopeptidase [Vicinamibacterales bacterium]|jgi:aminopeptidase N|nr:M1 family aminopeptidase [Vicinamibacterales bacterium]
MRLTLAVALLALFAVATAQPPQHVDVYQRPERAQRNRDYDVLRYRIELTFHQDARSFEGAATVTLRPLRDDFALCVLDAETFKVSRVVMEAGTAPLTFEQSATALSVHLPRSYAYGQQLAFTVYYREDDPHVDASAHGMPANYDLGLTFKAATSTHPRLANTLSFPEGARHWFPCDDQPDDKAASDVIVNVDPGDQAISNGRLVTTTEDPATGRRTFHWSEDKPFSTYLFVVVVGPYVKVEDRFGTLPVNYWVYADRVADARRSFHNTPKMIRFFNETFGFPYPWPKYDQIVLPHFGGGAESTSATVVGDGTLHDAKADPDFPSDSLVAHELAHQWWGDLVTMRDWSQTWLNEAFATYFEYVYSRRTLGDDEGALNLLEKTRSYLQEAHTRYERPIVFQRWNVPNDNFDRHTYQKGAVVLHMLEWVIGEANFRRALSSFLHKHAYEPVDTHDLQDAISESTGQSLDWFFDEWVYKAGHPVFEVGYSWTPSPGTVRLSVRQVQPTSENVPVFQMPVVIGITTPSGTAHDRVWIRKADETFELPSPEKPLMIRFDEGNHLLKELTFRKSSEELLFQLRHDDVIGRLWAAEQLSERLREPDVDPALRQAAADDPFWAVRREAIQRLASSFAADDVPFLRERALDPASRVRAAALRALGDLRDRALEPYFRERYAGDESYLAQAEAVRAIGKCGDPASIPFLDRVSDVRSPNDIIHAAAVDALKALTVSK